MNWIPSLLELLAKSKLLVVAVFVSTLSLYFGPKVAPVYFQTVPREWSIFILGSILFSGTLLLGWFISSFMYSVNRLSKKMLAIWSWHNLDSMESWLLFCMADYPFEPFDLKNPDYRIESPIDTVIQALETSHKLCRKGFIMFHPSCPELVYLTALGRKKSLAEVKASMRDIPRFY